MIHLRFNLTAEHQNPEPLCLHTVHRDRTNQPKTVKYTGTCSRDEQEEPIPTTSRWNPSRQSGKDVEFHIVTSSR